jgi:hypothetical protein
MRKRKSGFETALLASMSFAATDPDERKSSLQSDHWVLVHWDSEMHDRTASAN